MTWRIKDGGDIHTLSEEKLRKKLRSGDYSGVQLVVREGDSHWLRLYQLPLFREEVPVLRNPRQTALWRELKGFTGHLLGFLVVFLILAVFLRSGVTWMGIWGIFLVWHGVSVLPAALALLRPDLGSSVAEPQPLPGQQSAPPALPRTQPAAVAGATPDPIAEELALLRADIAEKVDDGSPILADVDQLVGTVVSLAGLERELRAQTDEEEEARVVAERDACQARLDSAHEPADRELFGRQLSTLERRLAGIASARQDVARLEARRSLALNQIKELRLELARSATRAPARGALQADLSQRLVRVQEDLDAARELDNTLARARLGEG